METGWFSRHIKISCYRWPDPQPAFRSLSLKPKAMATTISPPPQTLILKRSSISTSVCFPSSQRLVSAPQTCSVSVNSVSSIHFPKSKRLNRSPARAQASSVASFSQNVGDLLGDVSIFTATGEPVKFKDLWDQKQVIHPHLNLYWWSSFLRFF